jgi:Activator of Hsp90 ATPase homolog 1-like protein
MAEMEPIDVVRDGPDWLVIATLLPDLEPASVLPWFVDASLLNQWWGDEALIEPRPGGRYQVVWPGMGWTMRGTVALVTGDTLAYSWTWDHEPEQPARTVIVHVAPAPGGTRLTLTHGPYRAESDAFPEDSLDRAGHREGWLYFLPRLHAKMTQSQSQ